MMRSRPSNRRVPDKQARSVAESKLKASVKTKGFFFPSGPVLVSFGGQKAPVAVLQA